VRFPTPVDPSMQTLEPVFTRSSTGSIQSRRCFGPCIRAPIRDGAPS
jgi:hypothetical protein